MYSRSDIEAFIQKNHKTKHGHPKSLNTNTGSVVVDLKSIKYKDDLNGVNMKIEWPKKNKYSKKLNKCVPSGYIYNIDWAMDYFNKNRGKNVKLITLGANPKVFIVRLRNIENDNHYKYFIFERVYI